MQKTEQLINQEGRPDKGLENGQDNGGCAGSLLDKIDSRSDHRQAIETAGHAGIAVFHIIYIKG